MGRKPKHKAEEQQKEPQEPRLKEGDCVCKMHSADECDVYLITGFLRNIDSKTYSYFAERISKNGKEVDYSRHSYLLYTTAKECIPFNKLVFQTIRDTILRMSEVLLDNTTLAYNSASLKGKAE